MKTNDTEIFYSIALNSIRGIGPVIARKLIDTFGSAEMIFREKPELLRQIPRYGELLERNCRSCTILDPAEKELDFIRKHDIRAIALHDDDYPQRMLDCVDAPILLFYKGTANLNARHMVAIVGTRNSTPYGMELTEQFVRDLSSVLNEVVIVSGLAYGTDVNAHRFSLQHDIPTVGVLAHGLDRIYPDAHRNIARDMVSRGGLLTEYPAATTPDKGNFLARNRIIAGISDAVIIVETAEKGGSVVTANIANTYGRDVFAFPGRVYDTRSKGCNRLIRHNKAGLITQASDFLEMMNWQTDEPVKQAAQLPIGFDLTEDEQKLVDLLAQHGEMQLNRLAVETEKPVSILTGLLMDLELRGLVRSYPGAIYRLKG